MKILPRTIIVLLLLTLIFVPRHRLWARESAGRKSEGELVAGPENLKQIIPVQTVTSSLKMKVWIKVDGKEYKTIGTTPGTVKIPACEDRYFNLTGLIENQRTETRIRSKILNKFTHLGLPQFEWS